MCIFFLAANREELDAFDFLTADSKEHSDYLAISELPIGAAVELNRQGKCFVAASHVGDVAAVRRFIPDNTLLVHMHRDNDGIMRGTVLKSA